MTLKTKQWIIFILGIAFLGSLGYVQWQENIRRAEEAGLRPAHVVIPVSSKGCVECHKETTPGIIDHWTGSTHAEKQVGCVECHRANIGEADAFDHYGTVIATIVTPKDCARCHEQETEEFMASHHATAGNILESLDNILAETVEGHREPFNPHSPTPGRDDITMVNGMASVNTGCKQCHGSKIGIETIDGGIVTVDDLKPDESGMVTQVALLAKLKRNDEGQPIIAASTWPNTGIGRINLDGSRGSCSACHSRHDFSPRRARRPENCGKCHLGPDHPQKEIYDESKHGVAYRDLKEHMNLDSKEWVLGRDYTQAPTCATCHMSAHTKGPNGQDSKVTHDPGIRLSWTNRPPISATMDTDKDGKRVKETDPKKRAELVAESWEVKRTRMQNVCSHCHTKNYVNNFYKQYDEFVVNYNEKFAKPGTKIMNALKEHELRTPKNFDEEIEWTWFYLWHHEGRRARHGASMMAPDYAHWHGMYEVAERFYMELIPQALEHCEHGEKTGLAEGAAEVRKVIEEILARPEHEWFMEQRKLGTEDAAAHEEAAAAESTEPATEDAVGEDAVGEDAVAEDAATAEAPAEEPATAGAP